jgi:hypothetical protein
MSSGRWLSVALAVLFLSALSFGQRKSAVEFYDEDGNEKTAAVGWTGTKADGNFFVETPGSTTPVTVKDGNMSVPGGVTAASFNGDGSGLVNLPVPSASEVEGLDAALGEKVGKGEAGAVTGAMIQDSAVSENKLSTAVVNKLNSTTIPDNAVTSAKIADGTIASGDLSSTLNAEIDGKAPKDSPRFTGEPVFTADTLVLRNPRYSNKIKMTNSELLLEGFPAITAAPDYSVGAQGILFGQPMDFDGGPPQTTYYFRHRVHEPGMARIHIADNLSLESTGGADNSRIYTITGPINLAPKNGVVQVNGVTVHSSDSILKRNVKPIESVSEKIERVKGVYFEFKADEFPDRNLPAGRHIGVIAQDVETVFPELVTTDSEGMKAVAYPQLTAVLIEAAKAQNARIREQQERIDELSAEVEALKDAVSQVNHLVNLE